MSREHPGARRLLCIQTLLERAGELVESLPVRLGLPLDEDEIFARPEEDRVGGGLPFLGKVEADLLAGELVGARLDAAAAFVGSLLDAADDGLRDGVRRGTHGDLANGGAMPAGDAGRKHFDRCFMATAGGACGEERQRGASFHAPMLTSL